MLYQVTAYSLLGGLQVQVTTAEADPSGYQWAHRIMEFVELPDGISDDPWDVIWVIGELMSKRATQLGKGAPF